MCSDIPIEYLQHEIYTIAFRFPIIHYFKSINVKSCEKLKLSMIHNTLIYEISIKKDY